MLGKHSAGRGRRNWAILPVVGCLGIACIVCKADGGDRARFAEFAKRLDAVPPTPSGKGHLGRLDAGRTVHLRFPVPADPVAGYRLHLGNVVAFTGRGTSYRLILRRDRPDGAVIHRGPVIADGDAWNADNRQPIDVTRAVTEADRKKGFLDVFVTAETRDDGWTVYRHNPGRPIFASAVVLTPELQAHLKAERALAERGISLLPMPKTVVFADGPGLQLKDPVILLAASAGAEARAAAEELKAVVAERTGVSVRIAEGESASAGPALALRMARPGERSDELADREGYVLKVRAAGAEVVGGGAAGLFYGAMTMAQLLQPGGAEAALTAPACLIRDAPAFRYRIIQYDIARGQTVNVPYVKRLIRSLARCKVNAILFYMEDDFKFRKYPFLGRPGTFTHEKARALSEYARRFHVQLIPQFESLGHAAAVLRHPELADLRENGSAWDFCTTNPKTWTFLDDVFGELTEAFPYSEFIHVGGDEFEMAFGKCPRCWQIVEKDGVGALYALHMNRLNRLVKKHGRTALFWTSHTGPAPALSRMTLRYADRLEKDMIPTEWIYHGPAAYPTIDAYRKAGFRDVFCCPAVVSYSRVWPDYRTTFRGISGFFRAGARRKCGGAYCTTWEFMHGALIENSMYGLIYAAECAWNPFGPSKADFDRRFGAWWLGLNASDARLLADTFYAPFEKTNGGNNDGNLAVWRNGRAATHLLWLAPDRVLPDWMLRTPHAREKATALLDAAKAADDRLRRLEMRVRRNRLTLRAARLAFAMLSYAARKPLELARAAHLYRRIERERGASAADIARDLRQAASVFRKLADEVRACAAEYRYFVENCGAYKGDFERLQAQARKFADFAKRLGELAGRVERGEVQELPVAGTFGLVAGRAVRLGEWTPETVSEKGVLLRFALPDDVVARLAEIREVSVSWEYRRGAHGLAIRSCRLMCDGRTVAEDRHSGWAGAGTHDNVYGLKWKTPVTGRNWTIAADVASHGGRDSFGDVWLIVPDEK